jgi:hypothetical protein
MNRFYFLSVSVIFMFANLACVEAAVPDRTILFLMDGLCVGSPERLPLPNFQNLKKEGCYYKAVHLPLPAHPKEYKYYPHTCSVPNPVMMTGNVLFQPGDKMIQHAFGEKKTAFVTNSKSYLSVSEGFDIYQVIDQDPPSDDVPVVEKAKEIIEKEEPVFMRVHLQGPGRGGYDGSVEESKGKSWYRNIWHPESLYVTRMKKADRLLGEFVQWLKSTSRLEKTVMIITSDNGQAVIGGHPPYEAGSSTTPMLIFGPGIQKGRTFDYAEIIDIIPTIAYMHNISAPGNFNGRVLLESIVGSGKDTILPDRYMERLNNALLEQHKLSVAVRQLPITIDDIARWHERFKDMKSLVEYNEKISEAMKAIAGAGVTEPVFSPASGTYSGEVSVTISCDTEGAAIRYTTDANEPTEESTLYTGTIKINKTTGIKARAFKSGVGRSYIGIAEYTITKP